jgi:hemoglobin-like flavoprotein
MKRRGTIHTAQVQLVQSTFEQVRPLADTVATMFYDRLFAIDPSTRPLFKGDLQKQCLMLMSAIGLVVNSLDRPETMIPMLQNMGKRRVGYGVTREQYTSVSAALLWALEQSLGADFTPAVQAAWRTVYELLASIMQTAAAEMTGATIAPPPAPA